MNFKNLNRTNDIFIIAEIGNNHEGNFNTAVKLIREAKKSGVDAVKFQTYKTENFINKFEKKRFKKLKSFELTFEQFYKLSKIAKKNNLKFISTPLDLVSANFLEKIVDFFKIASGDNNYYELINQVLNYKKPTIISTGLTNLRDLKNLLNFVKKKNFSLSKLAFLHCVSSYPVEKQYANLLSIKFLKKELPITIGYSDHTIGIAAPLGAVTLGAKIIEKHFTLDNNFSSFRDHKLSLNPKRMKEMVSAARVIPPMLGREEKKVNKEEIKTLRLMRRSLYAKNEIMRGQKILRNDINIVRPFVHLKPEDLKILIGKKSKINTKSGYPIFRKK